MKKCKVGFSVVGSLLMILAAVVLVTIFLIQKNNFDAVQKDDQAKTAINAMYYSLENVFYAHNGYYPESIDATNLPSVTAASFKDPNGITINTAGSQYSYTPLNCSADKCRSYSLKTTLINEADYIKTSRQK